jgi:hypothetical protein
MLMVRDGLQPPFHRPPQEDLYFPGTVNLTVRVAYTESMRCVAMTAVLVTLTCVLPAAPQVSDSPQIKKLTPDELNKLLNGKDKHLFLDVREPRELEEFGTVKGYVNIPVGELESRLKEIPKDAVIVTL